MSRLLEVGAKDTWAWSVIIMKIKNSVKDMLAP